jgi:hypothetical protein
MNKERGMSKDCKEFDLEERLIDFAVHVIQISESLPNSRVGNHIAGQIIRSGTSPAPNYGEAKAAESRADFIHNRLLKTPRAGNLRMGSRLKHAGMTDYCK